MTTKERIIQTHLLTSHNIIPFYLNPYELKTTKNNIDFKFRYEIGEILILGHVINRNVYLTNVRFDEMLKLILKVLSYD